ncbi:MAG: dihydrodipicolinate synthase family protein [Parcubacteria group bacterium]|nr:dihydrodipicolinate synthase family protein [Parcubacteria group bacterium]
MKPLVKGVYAMLVTPMFPNEDVNYDALRAEVRFAGEHGAVGVVVTPSIGEFACLFDHERKECFRVCAEEAKRYGMITIAMTADTCTKKIAEHTRIAIDLGYDAAQLTPPYYWTPDDEEVFDHYLLAAEMGLPVIVYHNPMLSKVTISVPLLERIADIPGVVAMKEVATDRQVRLEPLFAAMKGKLDVFLTYRAFTTGLLLGSSGGFANVQSLPFCVKMYDLWQKGERDYAEEIQNLLNIVLPRGGESNKRHIGTNKFAASLVTGIDMGSPRASYGLPSMKARESIASKLPALWDLIK